MKNKHRYTEAENNFLHENISKHECYADLTDAFNFQFGLDRKTEHIREHCTKRLKIKLGKNKTSFKNGCRHLALPIGTIRRGANGTYIKVSDVHSGISGYSADWMPLQQKVWEDANGKMPEGKMICFLDCDHENFALENLHCIDRRISIILTANKWWSEDSNITLTAIKWAEMYWAIKGVANNA